MAFTQGIGKRHGKSGKMLNQGTVYQGTTVSGIWQWFPYWKTNHNQVKQSSVLNDKCNLAISPLGYTQTHL